MDISARDVPQDSNSIQSSLVLSAVDSKNIKLDEKVNTFASTFFRVLDSIGELGTMPIAFVVTAFQKEKGLPLGVKKVVVLTLSVLFVLPSAILSIPGLSLRTIAAWNREHVAFSPATKHLEEEHATKGLNVMTWNTGLGPGFMSLENGLDLPETRVKSIAEQIVREGSDVVALQEVFDHNAAQKLVEELNEKGYDCIHSILPQGATQLTSGLLLAVKRQKGLELSIEEVRVWQFNNLAASDKLSNKGLLGAKLRIKKNNEEKVLYTFNTHLQASYGKDGYGKERREQVEGIASAIQDWATEGNVILCGDLNFAANPLEEGDSTEEYQEQMEILQKVQLKDVNRKGQIKSKHKKGQGTFINVKKENARVDSIVDYILVSKTLKSITKPRVVDISTSKEHPSDHCPIVYQVSV